MSIRSLTPQLQERARNELNEDSIRLENDLRCLEEWLSQQPHLNIRRNRQWLVAFLRCCKFNLQRAKDKLDYFYTKKSMTPEFFSNKDPMLPEIQRSLDSKFLAYILDATENANVPAVMMIRLMFADPNKMHVVDMFRTMLMSLDVLLYRCDNLTIAGQYIIIDIKDFPLKYITQLSPRLCKKVVVTYTKAYPLRIKGVYVINCHPICEIFINMFKVFMSGKILQRFKILREGNFHQVFQDIPSHVLPKEYGGASATWNELAAKWKTTLEKHRNWLMEDDKYFCDENKRGERMKRQWTIWD